MHPVLVLFGIIAVVLFMLWRQKQQRNPALPAPLSPFERDVRASEFENMVLESSRQTPVLVDFYARWCGPCHRFAPVIAEVAKEFNGGFLLARVNFDESQALIERYGVTCIPTVALFQNGTRVDGFEGGRSDHQLRYFLATHGIKPVIEG
jgi:putative thioredoxin